jgi:HEPN domain-containing protein
MTEEITVLLKRAGEDCKSATILKEAGLYNNACVLSQQCIEKSLKAMLNFRGKPVPFVHNISQLIFKLEEDGVTRVPNRIKDNAIILTTAYITSRYTADDITERDIHDFTKVARFTFDWVSNIVK